MSEDQTQNLTSDDKLNLILERLAAREAKSSDTRPLHEQMRAELMEVRQELKEVKVELRKLNTNHETMIIDLTNARSSIRDLNHRGDDLERPRQ